MKALVVYDSAYGNTEKIAQAIGLGMGKEAKVYQVKQAQQSGLVGLATLVIGSPTQGGRPTAEIHAFIDSLSGDVVKNVQCAVFDTRMPVEEQVWPVKLLMRTIGYAAEKMGTHLAKKGGKVVGVKGFVVKDKEGPLGEGEEKRAKEWGRSLL